MSLFEIIAISFTAIYFLTYLGFVIWDKILDYKERKLKEDKYNENI